VAVDATVVCSGLVAYAQAAKDIPAEPSGGSYKPDYLVHDMSSAARNHG